MSRILDRIEREMKRPQRTRRQVLIRRVSIIFLCIAIPIVGGELGLRLAGYHRPQIDNQAQQKLLHEAVSALNKRFNTNAFEFDPHLLWKLSPGSNLAGLNVDDRGLLTWERPPAGPRNNRPLVVLCLGDSVTATTYRTYPQIAERLAAAGAQSRSVQVINAAVPGYSTEQALRVLPSLRSIKPDVVVLAFGWNDHFPALRLPDRELGAANIGSRVIHDLLKDVRLYQLLGAPLGVKLRKTEKTGNAAEVSGDSRVPLSQFRENLRELVELVRGWSAVPVLATEPENLGEVDEKFLEQNQFVAPGGRDNRSLHADYNKAVREASVALKVPLLDLEEEFVRRPRDFMLEPDGIHLTGRGHNHVARLVLGALRNESMITQGEYDAIANAEKHDTTAPDKPKVSWSVVPDQVAAHAGQPFTFSVIPQNSGNTRWLARHIIPQFGEAKNVSYGSTSVFTRWRTVDSPTTGIVATERLRADVLPGEATSITLTMIAPVRPGNYEVEIGLMCDSIGPLAAYGAESTTLTLSSVAEPEPQAQPPQIAPVPAPVDPPAVIAPATDTPPTVTLSTEPPAPAESPAALPPLESVPPPPTADVATTETVTTGSQ